MVELHKSRKIAINEIHLDAMTIASYKTPVQQKRIVLMAESLRKKGQLESIIVSEDLSVIWRGHTRYFAAKKLKWKTIEAIIMNNKEWNDYILTNNAHV